MDERGQEQIARGLCEGSREAWLRLYDEYARRVWRETARLLGGDAAATADVVQETFLAAARSARTFDPRRGSLWGWLWGIARLQAALHCRESARRDDLDRARQWWGSLDGEKRGWVAGKAEAPPEVLASRELATLVRQTLAELPTEYQTILTAKYMDGRAVEAIADELGSTGSAVRSKLARARRAFRRGFARLTHGEEVV